MENQQNTRSIAINYGLILGGIFILISVVKFAMGQTYEQEWYSQVLSIVLLIAFIVLGIKEYKKRNANLLSLGQGIKTGLGIALISALLFSVYFFVFTKFVEPNFVENIVKLQREQMLDNPNMTEEMVEQMGKNTREYFYIFSIGWIMLLNIFIGFVISLIASLVMQQKEDY